MSALSTSGNQNVGDLADGMSELVGQPLASVEFVQDYVQLHFDGPTLTAYTLPTVRSNLSEMLECGDPGWRELLCKPIGSVVRRTQVLPERVSIEFENGVVVEVSLKDEDYKGPEALQFSLDAVRTWVA
jgi:hypothetical protein